MFCFKEKWLSEFSGFAFLNVLHVLQTGKHLILEGAVSAFYPARPQSFYPLNEGRGS